jgi:hypothetical protein
MHMRRFWGYFVAALGTLSSMTTLVAFIASPDKSNLSGLCIILYAIVIVVICVAYGIFMTKDIKKIDLYIHPKLSVIVKFGDLFSQKGVVVIPVNEYFDTIVDDKIIAHKTIHGIFIDTYFKDRLPELDSKISSSLDGISFKSVIRKTGKQKIYDLGTCADVEDGQNIYVLVAVTHFDENDKAFVSVEELRNVYMKLFDHLEKMANSRPVYLPLIGAGQSKVPKSPQRLLLFMLNCWEFFKCFSMPAGVNIILHSSIRCKINLLQIEEYYTNNLLK